jgi:hypothetical protein
MKTTRSTLCFGVLAIMQVIVILLPKTMRAQQAFEAYYNYLGNYPYYSDTDWHNDAQGLAHDENHWFITQTGRLRKIPVSKDLEKISSNESGVIKIRLDSDDCPKLVAEGYSHFGDPDYLEIDDKGYVIVPIEGGDKGAVAIFRASDLKYVNHAYLTGQDRKAPWCAIDKSSPDRFLFSSKFEGVSAINRYKVNWRAIIDSDGPKNLGSPIQINLKGNGGQITLENVQGGEITPSGNLLYLVCGNWNKERDSDGLHVFEFSSDQSNVKRLRQSSKSSRPFEYGFYPGATGPNSTGYEEPEGLTIWDLDAHSDAHEKVKGQLHVLLLDTWPKKRIYMKHYTHTIYVDENNNGGENGTPDKPYKTFAKAYVESWDGQRIDIKPGKLSGPVTLSNRIEIIDGN